MVLDTVLYLMFFAAGAGLTAFVRLQRITPWYDRLFWLLISLLFSSTSFLTAALTFTNLSWLDSSSPVFRGALILSMLSVCALLSHQASDGSKPGGRLLNAGLFIVFGLMSGLALVLPDWFDRRLSLENGLVFTGTLISILTLFLTIQALYKKDKRKGHIAALLLTLAGLVLVVIQAGIQVFPVGVFFAPAVFFMLAASFQSVSILIALQNESVERKKANELHLNNIKSSHSVYEEKGAAAAVLDALKKDFSHQWSLEKPHYNVHIDCTRLVESMEKESSGIDEMIKVEKKGLTGLIELLADESGCTYDLKGKGLQWDQEMSDISQRNHEITGHLEHLIKIVGEGKELVQKQIHSMENIHNTAGKLQDIVDIMRDISDQTNMLSINAAIEAFHSGMSGEGLTVISEGIREIAVLTSDEAQTISASIEEIFKDSSIEEKISSGSMSIFSEFSRNIEKLFLTILNNVEVIKGLQTSMANINISNKEYDTKLHRAFLQQNLVELDNTSAYWNNVVKTIETIRDNITDANQLKKKAAADRDYLNRLIHE